MLVFKINFFIMIMNRSFSQFKATREGWVHCISWGGGGGGVGVEGGGAAGGGGVGGGGGGGGGGGL